MGNSCIQLTVKMKLLILNCKENLLKYDWHLKVAINKNVQQVLNNDIGSR